jgi:hypothetical protein
VHSPSSVQKARRIKVVTRVGDWTQTTLCVRYAELLRLRRAILKMEFASGWSGCRVGLAPTGKRRLVTAHTLFGSRPIGH